MSLASVLADLYPDSGSIRRILDEARIPAGSFALGEPAINIWSRALDRARDNQQMWELVQIPLREYDKNPDLREAWEVELSQRRASVSERGGGDTALALIMDLIWDTRIDQKDVRKQVSDLRHESREAISSLKLIAEVHKRLLEGHAADIAALKERPETYSTRVVLALALLVGALGGLFAAWGRMIWQWLIRILGG